MPIRHLHPRLSPPWRARLYHATAARLRQSAPVINPIQVQIIVEGLELIHGLDRLRWLLCSEVSRVTAETRRFHPEAEVESFQLGL